MPQPAELEKSARAPSGTVCLCVFVCFFFFFLVQRHLCMKFWFGKKPNWFQRSVQLTTELFQNSLRPGCKPMAFRVFSFLNNQQLLQQASIYKHGKHLYNQFLIRISIWYEEYKAMDIVQKGGYSVSKQYKHGRHLYHQFLIRISIW